MVIQKCRPGALSLLYFLYHSISKSNQDAPLFSIIFNPNMKFVPLQIYKWIIMCVSIPNKTLNECKGLVPLKLDLRTVGSTSAS